MVVEGDERRQTFHGPICGNMIKKVMSSVDDIVHID